MKLSAIALAVAMALSTVTAEAKSKKKDNSLVGPKWACTMDEAALRGISGGLMFGGALLRADTTLHCLSIFGEHRKKPVTISILEGSANRWGFSLTLALWLTKFSLGVEDIDNMYKEFSVDVSTGATVGVLSGRASAGSSLATNGGQYGGGDVHATLSGGIALGLEWNVISGSLMVIEDQIPFYELPARRSQLN